MGKKPDDKPKKQKRPTLKSVPLDQLRAEPRPLQPWQGKESTERFQHSADFGHTQIFFKCQGCGLEFMLMTWRNSQEIPQAFGITSPIGPAQKITCPECGENSVFCMGWAEQEGAISTYVHQRVRHARRRLVDPHPETE